MIRFRARACQLGRENCKSVAPGERVEVRSLGKEKRRAAFRRRVGLIEMRDGQYFITGRQNDDVMAASVAPTGLSSPKAAINSATSSADLLGIPLIYVRDR
jgi:hypothetical protein